MHVETESALARLRRRHTGGLGPDACIAADFTPQPWRQDAADVTAAESCSGSDPFDRSVGRGPAPRARAVIWTSK